jgi:hypothetical protein
VATAVIDVEAGG